MWKNSTLSNPIHYSSLYSDDTNPCNCLYGNCGTIGGIANFGEMESVTCHICTPQNQEAGEKSFSNAHFPCVDQLA